MNRPEPQTLPIDTLINDIDKGLTKIPQFQRDFVWTKEKSAKLIDSILKGYPIGTFIIWKTKETLRSVRNIGSLTLPTTPEGDFTQFVLDGQQRMTSIYACIKGVKIEREGKTVDFAELFVDLEADSEGQIVITQHDEESEFRFIKFKDLFESNIRQIVKFPEGKQKLIQAYRDQIRNYLFSTIMIRDVGIDIATDIFTRLNTSGKELTVFEIMVAKTYSDPLNFDLSEKFDELKERISDVGYSSIPAVPILQVVSALLVKDCSTKAILSLPKKGFIETWPKAVDAVDLAIDYFKNVLRIHVSELLPYNGLVVPFAYFFHHHPSRPSGDVAKYLQDLFWRISLGGRYTSGLEAKLAQDIKRVDKILAGKLPKYDWPIDSSSEFISENGYFAAGRSYIKALLCILVYHNPKSFKDNGDVDVRNEWLKRANSRNYHHFFPRAFLRKIGTEDFYANHIANITIVDDWLNKRDIGAKKPSHYLKVFDKVNPELDVALRRNHLINRERDRIDEDEYDTFYDNRLRRLSAEINKRIIPQAVDKQGQAPIDEDVEQDEESPIMD